MNISAKLPTEKFEGPRYSIVAWARGHEILFYREFGSYQGEWVMISHCDEEYYIWKGSYGSCSGCDAYEAEMYGDGAVLAADERTQNFINDYVPFLEVPARTMRNLIVQDWTAVRRLLPLNVRADGYDSEAIDGYGWDEMAKDVTLSAKLKESLPITLTDIMEASDQEIKQRALKVFGYERFVTESHAETLDENGENKLLGIGDVKLLSLKDSSTDRRYLLRVPPEIKGVQQGVAWTFGYEKANEYAPLIET